MLAAFTLVLAISSPQIPDFGGKEQIEKMKKLEFLVGTWKGDGAYDVPGRKIETECYEKVEWAAGGSCLLVIGKHHMKGPDGQKLLIHDTAALIRYDVSLSKHRMRSQLANGLSNEFDIEVLEKGTIWGFEVPSMGATRYTMKIDDQGRWHEIGERSNDMGKTWTKFMEMTLTKEK